MENNENNEKKKRTHFHTNSDKLIILMIFITLIILILIGIKIKNTHDANQKPNIIIGGESWDGQQNKKPEIVQEFIEIPMYETLYVSEEEPYVYLNNPISNKDIALMHYTLTYKNINGETETIYDEDVWIEPGKALPADLYSILEPGKYEITLNITCINPDTGEPRNGANQKTTLNVN